MGYTTEFDGEFKIEPKLDLDTLNELKDLADADHRDDTDKPGYYCQWVPTDDGTALQWDNGEKFYAYIEWLRYIIDKILAPKGYRVNGSVLWQGEEIGDVGRITVADNAVKSQKLKVDTITCPECGHEWKEN